MRRAVRTLWRQRTFTIVALATLALGIAATTAMFAVVEGVLLRPLPYAEPDRLVQLSEVVPGGTPAVSGPILSNLTLHAWEPQRRTIGPIVHLGAGVVTIGSDQPTRVTRGFVGARFFATLGLHPVAGRFFEDADALADVTPVAVISDELWRDTFNRDRGAIEGAIVVDDRPLDRGAIEGAIVVDDRPHRIIGVAPSGIALPIPNVRLWVPTRAPALVNAKGEARVEIARAIARLAPGATPAMAAAEGTAIARSVARPIGADMLFGKGAPVEVHVRTIADQLTLRVRPALSAISIGVALLLLITCTNVANLFLSRGARRERDYAMRVALGAAGGRLIRETLAETLVVSMVGGIAGAALAAALISALPAFVPADFPRFSGVRFGWTSVLVAATVAIVSAFSTGIVPALRVARRDLIPTLRSGSGGSEGRPTLRAHRVLLVAESSLAMMLLVGAVVMGRSFLALMRIDPGYDAARVLTARIYLPGASRGQANTQQFVDELLARVRALPRVVAAGASNMAPFGQSTYVSAFEVPLPGRAPVVARTQSYVVTPGYAEALALRLRRGRALTETDRAASVQAIVVNEEFVRLFLGGAEPLGLRFEGQYGTGEIVGIVGNVLRTGLDQEAQAEMYLLAGRDAEIRREVYLLIRSADDAVSHAADVRQIVSSMRRDAAVDAIEPLTAQLSASVAQPRFAAVIVGALAALALLLAAIGLYGVLTYAVTERAREIGIRTALGASAGQIVRAVLWDGVFVTAIGLLVGVAGAALATRVTSTLLAGIADVDWISLAVPSALLLLVAAAACVIPAVRAIRVDPVVALRAD